MSDSQPALPGMDFAPRDHDTPMVTAARLSLAALRDAGQIEARHTVLVQLVLSLSGAIDAGVRAGRASAVAMAAKQLLETMLALDPPPEDGPADQAAKNALATFLAEVEAAANAQAAAGALEHPAADDG